MTSTLEMAIAIRRGKCCREERMDDSMATIVPMPSKALEGAGRKAQRGTYDRAASYNKPPESIPHCEWPGWIEHGSLKRGAARKTAQNNREDGRKAADDGCVGNG